MPAPREVACLGLLPKMSLAGASPVDVDGSGLLLQRLLAWACYPGGHWLVPALEEVDG